MHPRTLTAIWPSYLVLGAAFVFEGASLLIGFRELTAYRRERRLRGSTLAVVHASKDPAIFMTVLEDSAALVGLLFAAAGVTLSYYFGLHDCEGIASIAIGLVLMLEAVILGRESRSLIVGEAAYHPRPAARSFPVANACRRARANRRSRRGGSAEDAAHDPARRLRRDSMTA